MCTLVWLLKIHSVKPFAVNMTDEENYWKTSFPVFCSFSCVLFTIQNKRKLTGKLEKSFPIVFLVCYIDKKWFLIWWYDFPHVFTVLVLTENDFDCTEKWGLNPENSILFTSSVYFKKWMISNIALVYPVFEIWLITRSVRNQGILKIWKRRV